MKKIRMLILPALFATCLISCVTQNASKKTEITKEESGEVTQQKPTVYYAGIDGLKLYAQPALSNDHIVKLPLNERLLRYKISKGFAYVKVVRTGQVGWVDNGQLEWKKVTTEKKPGQEIGKEPPPTKEVGERTEEKRSGPGILKPAEVEAAPVPPKTPQTKEKHKKPDASVLDAL